MTANGSDTHISEPSPAEDDNDKGDSEGDGDFGDDFDDFEEGGEGDDFGDFDDGFHGDGENETTFDKPPDQTFPPAPEPGLVSQTDSIPCFSMLVPMRMQ